MFYEPLPNVVSCLNKLNGTNDILQKFMHFNAFYKFSTINAKTEIKKETALTLQKNAWKQKEEAKYAIASSDILFKALNMFEIRCMPSRIRLPKQRSCILNTQFPKIKLQMHYKFIHEYIIETQGPLSFHDSWFMVQILKCRAHLLYNQFTHIGLPNLKYSYIICFFNGNQPSLNHQEESL